MQAFIKHQIFRIDLILVIDLKDFVHIVVVIYEEGLSLSDFGPMLYFCLVDFFVWFAGDDIFGTHH